MSIEGDPEDDKDWKVELKHPDYPFTLDVLSYATEPGISVVSSAMMNDEVTFNGSKFKLADGELILWLLLESDQLKHVADIEHVMQNNKLDYESLLNMLDLADAHAEKSRLIKLMRKFNKAAESFRAKMTVAGSVLKKLNESAYYRVKY